MNFKEAQSQFPKQVYKITWVEEEAVGEESITLNSMADFTTLLEEVKQYNNDLEHKEHGYYQTVITRDKTGKCDKQL